jgi:hypothetical protein
MTFARIRLVVAALLLLGWLSYLGYLALGHPRAVVVSRSQMLAATYVVKAEVALDSAGKPEGTATVLESFGPQRLPQGEKIIIDNLNEARLTGTKPLSAAGEYLLLLERVPGARQFRVVNALAAAGRESTHLFLVYPWSGEVERQTLAAIGRP